MLSYFQLSAPWTASNITPWPVSLQSIVLVCGMSFRRLVYMYVCQLPTTIHNSLWRLAPTTFYILLVLVCLFAAPQLEIFHFILYMYVVHAHVLWCVARFFLKTQKYNLQRLVQTVNYILLVTCTMYMYMYIQCNLYLFSLVLDWVNHCLNV